MSIIQRFRDTVTGMFVSRKDAEDRPRETVRETSRRIGDQSLLHNALLQAQVAQTSSEAARILEQAIRRVLNRP